MKQKELRILYLQTLVLNCIKNKIITKLSCSEPFSLNVYIHFWKLIGLCLFLVVSSQSEANNSFNKVFAIDSLILTPSNFNGFNVSCSGENNGSINLTVNGGTSPFTYLWSGGETTEDISGLMAGTYSVTVVDATFDTLKATLTLAEPSLLMVSCALDSNVSCFGLADGGATATASGGIPIYSYMWSNGISTGSATNLVAAVYTVAVTDNNGCNATCNINITQPTVLTSTCMVVANVSCNGLANGQASVTAGGGTGPYTYLWSNAQTNAAASGLAAATYTVTVTDSKGCTSSCNVNITQPTVLTTTCMVVANVSCNGQSNGQASVTVGGGTGPYTYLWGNGQTNAISINLIPGSYQVTVTDGNGCNNTCSAVITQPSVVLATCSINMNVSCNGGNNGSANALGSGGIGPYTYLWSNGQTTNAAINLIASSFTVTVSDANNCTATCSLAISQPSILNVICSIDSNVTCNGLSDGGASVIVTGGSMPYDYIWSNGQTLASAVNLAAGVHTVTVIDALGCFKTCSVVISQPNVLTAVCIINQNVSCTGGNDGIISVVGSGGTMPYNYSWSTGATTTSISNLQIGTYTVTITDANNCTASCLKTITQPIVLSLICNLDTSVSCNGGNDGVASVIVSNGTSPYTYSWDNGQTTSFANGLAAGTHTVTITDFNSCIDSCQVIVIQPSELTINCFVDKNVSCNGLADGEASVTVSGGVGPYTYLWNGGSTNSNISGLIPGAYTVTVTDNNMCTSACFVSITQPAILTLAIIDSIDAKCFGSSDGSISVNVGGGTLPYDFLWSNLSTSQNLSNASAGVYTLTVTDINGCISSISSSFSEPSLLLTTIDTTNGICGFPNGQAVTSPFGGISPYSYLWSNGTTDSIADGLAQATYTVTITDANSCTVTSTAVVLNTGPVSLQLDSVKNASCNGFSDGYLKVSGVDGVSPYAYLWSTTSTSNSINALTAGNYTVTVTDNVSCTHSAVYVVSEPSTVSAVWNVTNPSCGLNNGALLVSGSGGPGPYTYLWSTGETINSIDSLSPGTYIITITGLNGCVGVDSVTITDQPGPIVTIGSITNTSCNSGVNGMVNINVTSGTSPIAYMWSNGQTNQDLINATAGSYMVTATDANGCFDTLSVMVSQPTALTIVFNTTSATCNLANGSINAIVTGGTGAYSYLWSTGATAISLGSVLAGAYVFTVTDVNLCTATAIGVVNNVGGPILSIDSVVHVDCFAQSTGAVYVNTSSGVAPYSFLWSNGATVEDIVGVVAANYTLTVTDNIGCITNLFATVNQPTAISIFFNVDNEKCNKTNGLINTGIIGGTPGYSYLWSNSKTTTSINSLVAGIYTLTVTDAKGCTKSSSTTVFNIPGPLLFVDSIIDVLCNATPTGNAYISHLGGTPPFAYSWSNGQTSEDLLNVPIGTYTLTITDANACTNTIQVNLNQPSALSLSTNSVSSTCGNANGGAIATPGGGVPPYAYLWSTGNTTSTIGGVLSGLYTITITDNNGCVIQKSVTITNISGPTLAINTKINVDCFGTNTGAISINVSGGTIPFTYNWSNSATTQNIINVIAGAYTVTVSDFNNCTAVLNATITQPPLLSINITPNSSMCSSNNGSASASVTGGVSPYTYLWSNSVTISSITGVFAGNYTVTVTDANGCSKFKVVTISDIPGPSICIDSVVNVDCFGSNTGLIDICLTNGTAPFSYLWSNGNSTQLNANLSANTYTVTVQDANACIATLSAIVTQPLKLSISITPANSTCGYANGMALTTISGGTPGYSYLWSNALTTSSITGLLAGIYTVTVTDINSCTKSSTVSVANIPGPLLSVDSIQDVNCYAASTGAIFVSHNSGIGPFTYLWSNSNTNQDLLNLNSGTYSLIITDSNTCKDTISAFVDEPTELMVSTNKINSICTDANGSISTTVSGGVSPYTYLWSNFSTNSSIVNLFAGTYTVTVTDANSCIKEETVIISTTLIPSSNLISLTNVFCFGGNNGSILISVLNGTAPFSYLWSNGNTTTTNNNLVAGLYTVIISDSLNCSDTAAYIIFEPSLLTVAVTGNNAICTNNNGTALAMPSGGTLPYSYIWSNSKTTSAISGLVNGIYTVTVTDGKGCTASNTVNIGFIDSPIASMNTIFDATCFAGNDGSINIDITNGSSPYSFFWSNGETTEDINSLIANTYTVFVIDSIGCTDTLSVTVNQPSAITASFIVTNASCGVSNGSAIIIAVGGTPGYSYLWSTGSTVDSIYNFSAGTYTVTITDSSFCDSTYTVNINNDGAPSVSLDSIRHVSCNGLSDGLINVNVNGGLNPYSYLWSNGATTQNISNIIAKTYTLTVIDANSCVTTTNYIVTQPQPLVGVTVTNDATCGLPNGSAVVAIVGGTSPYNYLWSSGSTSNTTIGQPGGPISVSITDFNNCKMTVVDTIFDAGNPTINLISLNNNLCFGDSIGIINVFALGGSPSYSYNWSNGKTTEDVSGLLTGIYTVTVTDQLFCTATSSYTILQPAELILNLNSSTPICNSLNGSLQALVSGGSLGYSYLWSTSDTLSTISSLGSGVYTVTVTDANNCTKTSSATLTDNGNPVISLDTIFNVKCYSQLTGQIFISTLFGTTPYSYAWSNGITIEDLLGVGANNYMITVIDSNGCADSSSFVITQPTELLVSLLAVPATCDSTNGSITSIVSGGLFPYSYLWSNSSTSTFIDNQNPGAYTLVVTDSNSCVTQKNDTILDLFSPIITLSTLSNVTCNGGSDGILNVNVNGPSQPFQYLWSNGVTIQDLVGIAAGTYTLSVTDTNNCVSIYIETITQPSAIAITSSIIQPSCNSANGSIVVTPSGGTNPYTFLWSNGGTTNSIANINSGLYTLTVTDALGCDTSFAFTLTNTGVPAIMLISQSNVKCFGGNDGSINITVSSGLPGYSYLWSPGNDTTEDKSGLIAGVYTLLVTDITGCTNTSSFAISQPAAGISIAFNTVPPSCGVNTGSACANIVGGTPGYTYLWSNGATSACINNIAAGTYTVTITDANACTKSAAVNLSDLSGPQIVSVDSTNTSCPSVADGTISLVISAANPPYTISWSNTTQTSDTITGLLPNIYTITITDSLGCKTTRAISIAGPAPWDITDSISVLNGTYNVSCNGLKDASIILNVNGGNSPYSFNWSNGTNTQNLHNIGAGTYTILITDVKGCDTSITYNLTQPPPLFGDPMGNTNVCGVTSVMLTAVSPPPGTNGYWVLLNPIVIIDDSSASNTMASNLQPGNNIFYWVVSDGVCFDSAEVVIIASDEINAIAGIDKVVCKNTTSLTATPIIYGYGYWTLISGTGIIDDSTMSTTNVSGLSIGQNEFLWTVVNGDCRDSAAVIITLDDPLDCIDPLEMPTGITPNSDTKNDNFVIKGLEAYPINELLVYNRWGNLVFDQNNYDNSWNGINNSGDDLPDGTYYVILRLNNGKRSINGYVDIRRR